MRREGGGERVGEGGLAEVAFLVKFWREDGVEKVVDGVGVSHQIIRYRDWLQKVIGRECVSCRMAVPGWLEKVWGRGGVSRQAAVMGWG